jgi:NhaP-type Na+/H+ or K+/H+ antiporter
MPQDLASASLLLSSGITLIAAFLGLRQWYERRARSDDLSDRDRGYFFRQDLRRGIGVGVMLLLAAGLYFGSRVPPQVGGKANATFLEIWLAISGLIVVMLVLALIDWISTRLYARRHQRALLSERRKLLGQAFGKKPNDRADESERVSD